MKRHETPTHTCIQEVKVDPIVIPNAVVSLAVIYTLNRCAVHLHTGSNVFTVQHSIKVFCKLLKRNRKCCDKNREGIIIAGLSR